MKSTINKRDRKFFNRRKAHTTSGKKHGSQVKNSKKYGKNDNKKI
ncbi:MAG: hypothetical protein AABY22_31605 [Nanoarchaeota archaeon]